MTAAPECPACQARTVRVCLSLSGVPVNQQTLARTEAAARECVRGDIDLAVCDTCGFVFNARFDPDLISYEPGYENSQFFSPAFSTHARDTAQRLIDRYAVRGQTVVDLGCGSGDFLRMICALGRNRGYGFDPSYAGEPSEEGELVQFVRDYFSLERHAAQRGNLVCSRQVLEHIQRPLDLLEAMRSAAFSDAATLYCEVPNGYWSLRTLAFWDVYYEHCSYFSLPSLTHLFRTASFAVLDAHESFGDQYLQIEARSLGSRTRQQAPREAGSVAAVVASVERFAAEFCHWRARMQAAVQQPRQAGQRAVVWGAGAKGVTLLNHLDAGPATIAAVVDINPRKRGTFIPGTAQPVITPADLADLRPDLVYIMNPIYREEIAATLGELGLSPLLVTL